ncbi:TolC family protein [candidate division WOR-3 bacterium]|nr:TolC family protein [candidate division WOR-3 bacterium]
MILFILLSLNLTLEDAIGMGLKESPTYLQAKKQFMITQKTNASAYSTLLPSAYAGYVEGRTRSRLDGLEIYDSTDSYYNIRMEWDLTPGDLLNAFSAHYGNSSAYFSFMETRNQTIYEIVSQYLNTLKLEKLFESRETAVRRTENNLNLIEEKKRLGSASNAEVLQGKVINLQAQYDLMETEKNRKVYLLRLKKLIGFEARDSLLLEEPTVDFKIPEKDSILILAMDNDPLINDYDSELKKARFDFTNTYMNSLFTVSFGALYQYQDSRAPSSSLLHDNYDYSIGFSISIPLFTGFSRVNDMMIAELRVDLAELKLKEREKELRISVEEDYMLYEEARQKLQLAETTLKFAEESHMAASERYRLGESSMIELLGAEEDLLRAQYSLTEARFDWYLSLYRLKRLMGRLYEE